MTVEKNELILLVKNMHDEGQSMTSIAKEIGVSRRTIGRWLDKADHIIENTSALEDGFDDLTDEKSLGESSDIELLDQVVKLHEQLQRVRDSNNTLRKLVREQGRKNNTSDSLHFSLLKVLEQNRFNITNNSEFPIIKETDNSPVGVLQISDTHFNEIVNDVDGNKFDFEVASKRIQKYVHRAMTYFKANGVCKVGIFFVGDLLNSDRRLSEITSAATNRSNAVFLTVDILQQMILDLRQHFEVFVASVTGNESRVNKDVDWTNLLASDSYDLVIHNMLMYLLGDNDGITFFPIVDPLEAVVTVNEVNFLLIHGHGHKGVANTSNIERETNLLKAKYASRGQRVDFVVMGHIHSCFISDVYARNSGLVGTNSYAEKALNLHGKASQNIHIVYGENDLDSIKVDLQEYSSYTGYTFNDKLKANYLSSDSGNKNFIIQGVLV